MIFWTTITNMMKYSGANLFPQVVFSQKGFWFATSYITKGQFSPVEMTNSKIIPFPKFLKFLYCGSSC